MAHVVEHSHEREQSIWSIPVQAVVPNPYQPRRVFDEISLNALAESISRVGLLQPISVRSLDASRYELIAGERRLRACKKLGLSHIDALVLSATHMRSALLALVENLQRDDLHYLDEAEGYERVLRDCDMTQEELAAQIGRGQSTIANKLRLLKLDASVREMLRACDVSERHARALLKLPLAALQRDAISQIKEQKLTVKQTEALVSSMLAVFPAPHRPSRRIIPLIRDHRLYVNAIGDIVRQMQEVGLQAQTMVKEYEDSVEITVRVMRSAKKVPMAKDKIRPGIPAD